MTPDEKLCEVNMRLGMKKFYINILDEMEKHPHEIYSQKEIALLLKKVESITDLEFQTINHT